MWWAGGRATEAVGGCQLLSVCLPHETPSSGAVRGRQPVRRPVGQPASQPAISLVSPGSALLVSVFSEAVRWCARPLSTHLDMDIDSPAQHSTDATSLNRPTSPLSPFLFPSKIRNLSYKFQNKQTTDAGGGWDLRGLASHRACRQVCWLC
ncbi:hypothetical protein IWX92DRAFT_372848 [Phyllosticta citricarpa]